MARSIRLPTEEANTHVSPNTYEAYADAGTLRAAMLLGLPFYRFPEYTLVENLPVLGPLKLAPFGPLVVVGIWLGWSQSLRYCRAKNINQDLWRELAFQTVVWGFIVAHLVSVIFYFPHQIEEDPWVLLKFWSGLSSVGGFFGAFLGSRFFLWRHRQPSLVLSDSIVFGLFLGWVFGRLGCATVHDHPGRVVEEGSFLALGPWEDGTWRYDLGLIEAMYAICLMLLVYFAIDWKNKRPGWLSGFALVAYAPFRFVLDFFRATEAARGVIPTPDSRYVGLTPAQWFTISFFLLGCYLMFVRKPKEGDFKFLKEDEVFDPKNPGSAVKKAVTEARDA